MSYSPTRPIYFVSIVFSLISLHIVGALSVLPEPLRRTWLPNWTKRAYTGLIGTVSWTRRAHIVLTSGPGEFDENFGRALAEGRGWIGSGVEMDGFGSVWIANHSTDLDWLVYLWLVFTQLGLVKGLLVVVGPHLLRYPVLGKALAMWNFPPLSKEHQLSDSPLFSIASSRRRNREAFTALIFPEGVFIDEKNEAKSNAFALKTNQPTFHHVLHPHSKGTYDLTLPLIKIYPNLRLFDVTLAFPSQPSPPSPPSPSTSRSYPQHIHSIGSHLFKGTIPANVHIHVRSWLVKELPCFSDKVTAEGEGLVAFDKWLREVWGEKDKLLRTFESTRKLGDGEEKVLRPSPRFGDVIALAGAVAWSGCVCWTGWWAVRRMCPLPICMYQQNIKTENLKL